MEASGNSINQQLEGFLASVRKLEESLAAEKNRNRKIAQDYLATRTILENAARDLQSRIGEKDRMIAERDAKIVAISKAYRALQGAGARAKADAVAAEEREAKLDAELAQFKQAWGEVLARENQARELVLEHEKAKRMVAEMRIRVHGLETSLAEANTRAEAQARGTEIYRRELQAAAIRLQAAESSISQLRREGAADAQRVRAEAEDRLQDERRTARAATQELERARAETERARAKTQAAIEESGRLRDEMKAMASVRASDAARASTANADLSSRLEAAQRELAMLRMEAKNAGIQAETIRKDASKQALMAALRHEAELGRLQARIDQLLERGLSAEAVDEAPAGEKVYSAAPVAIARSSRAGNVADQAQNAAESPL